MKADLAARDGDHRLCLLLGIAAWFLFLDHVPHNAVSLLTMRNFGFSGATDLFVFVGGYIAAILYGKMMLERGFVDSARICLTQSFPIKQTDAFTGPWDCPGEEKQPSGRRSWRFGGSSVRRLVFRFTSS